MLTHQEEQRVFDVIPASFSVPWRGSTYDYTAEKWWSDQDDDRMDYPRVVLDWNARDVEKDEHQPMNQTERVEHDVEASEVDYTKATRVYDELAIQCITNGRPGDDGVPAKSRAREMARPIVRFFRYDFDQNREGPNGERPVLARVVQPPTYANVELEGNVSIQYQFSVRLHHTERKVQTEDATEAVQGSVATSDEGGTDWQQDT